jgi:hypothetical protein
LARRNVVILIATAALLALALPAPGHSRNGSYAFVGGTAWDRAQVRQALAASSFDWSVIPGTVRIHLARGIESRSLPGEIWIDRDLLRSGPFGWAVVQDEYAHQIDFALFDDATRAQLTVALGGRAWCATTFPGLRHSDYGCERFSSTLVWAYWPSRLNAYKPESRPDEAAAMSAPRFRRLVDRLVAERITSSRR